MLLVAYPEVFGFLEENDKSKSLKVSVFKGTIFAAKYVQDSILDQMYIRLT